MFARVAVPVPLGRAFTYEVPDELLAQVVRGARVLCPFGKRRIAGIVLEVVAERPDIPPDKLKRIEAVVDAEPVLGDELLSFLVELSRYYLAPIGEVMRLALPPVERARKNALEDAGLLGKLKLGAVGRMAQFAVLNSEANVANLEGAAAELVVLLGKGSARVSVLQKVHKNARILLKRLEKAGIVRLEQRAAFADPFLSAVVEKEVPKVLTVEQASAVAAITEQLTLGAPAQFLLDGVTGSGKTEVYLRAVEHCVAQGGGAIVLVPEIALTPQLVGRFRARLGDGIGVVHSGLTEGARYSMWKALHSGRLKVAVGARSALFAPVQNLQLLCVDEEHDGSFKQEEGVRYHARDMALLRAHRARAVCVLGTATPSLGTEALVRKGRITRLRLPTRAREASNLPSVRLIDLRRMGPGPTGDRWLTLPLYRAIESTLAQKEQSILFLNRRGFAPSLICDACGHIVECPNCSVALTVHRVRREELCCHYCDYTSPLPLACPKCHSRQFCEEGAGTERVVAVLEQAFPTARIARLDRDVAAGAKSEAILNRVRQGEVDILVGTQMVTKGHDLPNVTFVGVLNADAALSVPDFYASERSFHLLVQVAGRAGRGDIQGTVMIQTRQPEHPAVRLAAQHDVAGFAEVALREREELGYPPYSRIALVRFDGLNEDAVRRECQRMTDFARRAASPKIEVLGPAPAPIARIRNRYRFRFMLRSRDRKDLRQVLLAIARSAPDRMVRMSIDVDPVSLLA